jgi:hypothetical protein
MYAPPTVQPGSSVSHWDTVLTPDQIMEPIYTGAHHRPVLELPLFQDIGWRLQSALVPMLFLELLEPEVFVIFSQNFDGVTAPALPAGWVTAATGIEPLWVTSISLPNSTPNAAFAPNVANIGNTTLDSPSISVPAAGATLSFKISYNMESTFDGAVLEVSINNGAFQDITTGGNAFIAGGYNGAISANFSSPIASRQAWTGLSGGTTAAPTYITSTINLPAAASGQPVKLRWRAASDNSVAASGANGVRIDNVTLTSR